jgi:predicted glycosyltransferase
MDEHRWPLPASRPLRVALYSHDTVGLGHIRRNILIARTISSSLPTSILLVAGAREAASFSLPPRTDCLTLPAFFKGSDGAYLPRCLNVPLEEFVDFRARTIAAALHSFAPDVLIVDKVPRGALRELQPALELLRASGAYCVLGLRDVLDEAEIVRREWAHGAAPDAVRDYYDAVWIYGDANVFDQVHEYHYPREMADKVRYTGYVTRPLRTIFSEIDRADLSLQEVGSSDRLLLCMVGGGQDGPALAETFAKVDFPTGTKGMIVTGPFMPDDALERLYRMAASKPRLCVRKFVNDPDLLLSLADRVVAMGGYNTVCELLSFHKRALIVPRMQPRMEQFIRAQRLQELGLIDMLHPLELSERNLAEWLARDDGPPARVHDRIDLYGAANLPRLLSDMLNEPPAAAKQRHFESETHYAAR